MGLVKGEKRIQQSYSKGVCDITFNDKRTLN